MKVEFRGLIANKKGQMAIEAVLLMTVLVGAFMFVTKYIRDKKLVQNMAGQSIDRLATMAGYGTWKQTCTATGRSNVESIGKCHPNSIHRSLSSDPNP